jgi:hypothetical protein
MKARFRARAQQARGQVLILMILLMTTLIIFFGMVVNIGHLVQAKINLQNAVDFAAMSGASWQARYLNHIALINYRMRQNYKFVLFDIYVTQSRHNRGFKALVSEPPMPPVFTKVPTPDQSQGGSLVLGICQTIPGYEPRTEEERRAPGAGFPSISTDFCKLIAPGQGFFSRLPNAPFIPIPIGGAIVAAQVRANQALKENCLASSGQNRAYFDYIIRHLRDRNLFQMEEMSIILRQFSQAFSKSSDIEAVAGNGEGDQTILKTFKDNLITANRDGLEADSLVYLNPPLTRTFVDEGISARPQNLVADDDPGGNFPAYFERQMVGFKLSVIESRWTGSGCQFYPALATAKDPSDPTRQRTGFVFLGLSRARETANLGGSYQALKIPFQITLRAKTKPNLLFWPRGLTPTLVAVASAKPFGSRIAPPIEKVNFEVSGQATRDRASGTLANISFYPGDIRQPNSSEFPGVGHVRILKHLDGALRIPSGGFPFRTAPNLRTGQMTPERPSVIDSSFQEDNAETCKSAHMPFLCNALAPTLYEGLLWTVFPDPPQALGRNASQVSEYPSEFSLPIGSSGIGSIFEDRIKKMTQRYFMEDRMPGNADSAPARIGARTSLWHVSTLIPREFLGQFSNGGKPLFYATESSAASAFNPDWPLDSLETKLGGANDGRRGYQIRLISLEQACEEINKSNSVRLTSEMRDYCEGAGKVFH